MGDPIRPPRHPICRSARQAWRRAPGCAHELEPGGRIILARTAARGASPMRPAHAKPNVVAVAWPDGDQDVQKHKPSSQPFVGTLGLETNRAPLPQSCSMPRLHRTLQGLYQRLQTVFKYALQARRARHFPAVSVFPSEPTALPRCFILFRLDLCHTAAPFVSPVPALLRYIHILVAVVVSLQGSDYHLMHACVRPS